MTETRNGHCLCGAVSIAVTGPLHDLGACHCGMCRRWTGSAFLGFGVAEADLRIAGADHVAAYRSSDWAERCFCRSCGSTLWYHLTIPGEQLTHYVAAGLLDDLSGLRLEHELFFDRKPEVIPCAAQSKKTTEAECLAAMSANPEE